MMELLKNNRGFYIYRIYAAFAKRAFPAASAFSL